MRRIATTIFAVMVFAFAMAQEKPKLAVYVHGSCSSSNKKLVSSKVISTILRSNKYEVVERTADFLEELRREQRYQYSGNVDDGQLIKLGKQFGVRLVCIVDLSENNYCKGTSDYNLISERLIDIETGLVVSAAGIYNFCIQYSYGDRYDSRSFDEVLNLITDVTIVLLQNITTIEGKEKIAVYITQNSNTYKSKCVSSSLIEYFTRSNTFIAVERTSDFLAGLRQEQSYQQSGNVDDTQLSRLGRQFGVNLVCVVDIIYDTNTCYVAVRIIDAEKGLIKAIAEKKEGWKVPREDRYTRFWKDYEYDTKPITTELMQQLGVCISKDQKIVDPSQICCEGLINRNGICRNCAGDTAYWLKDNLGFEVKLTDIEIKQGDVFQGKCKTCPEGWRMPTRTEFVQMLNYKADLNIIPDRYYLTSDFTITPGFNRKTKDHYYYTWKDSGFVLEELYYTEGSSPKNLFYWNNRFYIRCIKD